MTVGPSIDLKITRNYWITHENPNLQTHKSLGSKSAGIISRIEPLGHNGPLPEVRSAFLLKPYTSVASGPDVSK